MIVECVVMIGGVEHGKEDIDSILEQQQPKRKPYNLSLDFITMIWYYICFKCDSELMVQI